MTYHLRPRQTYFYAMPRLLYLLLFLTTGLSAQLDTLGRWRSHQSFSRGVYVTQSAEEVIYTTGNTLFFLDKEDLSFTPLTRAQGLAGGRINLLKYQQTTETLLIVYENSTLDLYRNGSFTTLRQIDNFNFSGDKRIYDLSFGADNRVYIAAGYGVSALSLNDETFAFTTFTGVRVNSVTEYAGHIYAATPEGVYRVPLAGVNLNDFNNWQLLGPAAGLPGDYSSTTLTVWRDRLYFAVNEDVYLWGGDAGEVFYDAAARQDDLTYLSGGADYLLAGYRCTTTSCTDGQLVVLQEDPAQARVLTECISRTNYAVEDERGRLWLGDGNFGIRYLPAIDEDCQRLTFPGPPTDATYRLLHDGTSLWVAPGQLDENTTPRYDFEGVYRMTDGQWSARNIRNTVAFRGRNEAFGGDDDVATIIDVDYDPVNDVHYLSSFFEGVIGIDAAGEATLYDEVNTSLQLAEGAGQGRIRAAGSATDAAGFTYFGTSLAAQGGIISVRSPEGEWAALGQSCNINLAIDIAVDREGYVWVVHRAGEDGGVTVIDPAGTPLDPSDDRCRTITAANSNLPTNQTRSIAVDLSGDVWIGTATGIVIFSCGLDVFDGEFCAGSLPVVNADDGFGGFLLETEEVRTIAVDGANRKWIGTNGGAYLLSERGTEQLLFFDRGNSPLLDDIVRSIAIDPTTGTVFFATELGTISYRGDATAAAPRFRELSVFPNPVEPGYDGPIAIDGLQRNARVKITDLSGKLVQEGDAAGGQFVWSGTDYNGRRVTSGVYLVFASTAGTNSLELQQQPESAVGKIVFLR